MLLALRPFDSEPQLAVRRQQGRGSDATEPMAEVRTGIGERPARRTGFTTASHPPMSLLDALSLLETLAPCLS
ncbi:MAG: hypothetical protein QOJ11_3493 [Frankiales bacterium]|jgi:hypothetical protein|nr:hypothetical protein [Frankiales bacterium]